MKNSEKICVLGQGGDGALANSFYESLVKLGAPVCFFDFNQYPLIQNISLKSKITNKLCRHSYNTRKLISYRFNETLIDFVLRNNCRHTLLVNPDWVMPTTVRTLGEHDIRTILFHADNPLPPHYRSRPESIELSRSVDCCLIWSHTLVKRLRDHGVSAEFMPFAWDPNLHPSNLRGGRRQKKSAAFIGGWDLQREEFLESFSAGYPLKIYGPDYWRTKSRQNSRVSLAWAGASAIGMQFSRIATDHEVNLNMLRRQHMVDGEFDGVIMRNFEVPGCGGFLMSTRTETAMSLFKEDNQAVYFDSVEECLDKIKFYSKRPDETKRIVEHAHELTKKHHTYHHRAAEIIQLFNKL